MRMKHPHSRGSHSFTLELNLSTFGHIHGSSWVTWSTKIAQVELKVKECKPLPHSAAASFTFIPPAPIAGQQGR